MRPPVLRRALPSLLAISAALLLREGAARADVAIAGYHIVPSEAVFTGLRDFPDRRFVIAVSSHRPGPDDPGAGDLPAPAPVRDGEPVPTDTPYFQELRALPADTPDPVTDAWVLASKTPTSGVFTRHPYRAPDGSDERKMRARFHVRQIQGGWISLEHLSTEVVLADGSARPLVKVIPLTWALGAFESPPGWKLFLRTDPAFPPADPPPAPVPLDVESVLPASVALRMLVAVEGGADPAGPLEGKPHHALGRPPDPWARDEVPVDSAAVEHRVMLHVELTPERELALSIQARYRDAEGRWFEDESMEIPAPMPVRWERWAVAGGACAALLFAVAWGWRRRRAAGSGPPRGA